MVPSGEAKIKPWKDKLMEGLDGASIVVDIGIGTAPNSPYYQHVGRVVGVDPNPAVVQYAERTAAEAGLPPGRVQMVLGSAERLPLEDGTADAVVCTRVLCSVPSVQQTLAEVLRVLKPGGRFIFIEHVAGEPGTRVAAAQRWLAPIVRSIPEGCNIRCDSLAAIRAAGFSEVTAEAFWVDMPLPAAFFGPHIAGTAIK